MNYVTGNVIFLDVDGVLATADQIHRYSEEHNGSCPPGIAQIDSECVKCLKYAVDQTRSMIVISSTWRKNPNDLRDLMIVLTIPVIGMTESVPSGQREIEIRNYMKAHGITDIENVVVIDDDSGDLQYFKSRNRLVQPTWEHGMTRQNAMEVIARLGRAAQ